MKKLKLRALELGAKEVLTRSQLKNVLGGSGGSCTCDEDPCARKSNGSACTTSSGLSGTCTYQACTGCNYSYEACVPGGF